jgi:hypothetical protein
MLGWVAAVTATVSPSQLSPAVNQRISISEIGGESARAAPLLGANSVISSVLAENRKAS